MSSSTSRPPDCTLEFFIVATKCSCFKAKKVTMKSQPLARELLAARINAIDCTLRLMKVYALRDQTEEVKCSCTLVGHHNIYMTAAPVLLSSPWERHSWEFTKIQGHIFREQLRVSYNFHRLGKASSQSFPQRAWIAWGSPNIQQVILFFLWIGSRSCVSNLEMLWNIDESSARASHAENKPNCGRELGGWSQ